MESSPWTLFSSHSVFLAGKSVIWVPGVSFQAYFAPIQANLNAYRPPPIWTGAYGTHCPSFHFCFSLVVDLGDSSTETHKEHYHSFLGLGICNCITVPLFNQSTTGGYVDYFLSSALVSNTATNTLVYVSVWTDKRVQTTNILIFIIYLGKSFWILLLLFSHSGVSDSLQPHGLQHARPPCPSLSPGACSNSWPLSRWCHPTISSSVVPFSSRLQSLPASGLFQWVRSSHQMATSLEIQLQHQSFQGIFRTVFLQDGLVWSPCDPRDSQESSPAVWKHQFFGAQPYLWSNSHIHTWLLSKNLSFDYMDLYQQSDFSAF